MSSRPLRFVPLAAVLTAAALWAGSGAAGDPLPLPEEYVEIAEPASGAADIVEINTSAAGERTDRRPVHSNTAGSAEDGPTGEGPEGVTAVPGAEAEAPPASRLLRSLDEWASQPAATWPSPSMGIASFDDAPQADGTRIDDRPGRFPAPGSSPVLHGCPRALLASLLAEATETADAVSALAIERETLSLCRERQEIVNGIAALEGELGTLLAEAQARATGPVEGSVGSTVANPPIVKESVPVRVVSLPPPASAAGEAPKEAEAPEEPAPPSYFWFSILGTAGDLRAGVSGGAGNGGVRGGTSIWFVREGDRLPGGVTVMRIVTRPPGVHVSGAVEAALPYRPRPAGTAGLRGDAGGDGS